MCSRISFGRPAKTALTAAIGLRFFLTGIAITVERSVFLKLACLLKQVLKKSGWTAVKIVASECELLSIVSVIRRKYMKMMHIRRLFAANWCVALPALRLRRIAHRE